MFQDSQEERAASSRRRTWISQGLLSLKKVAGVAGVMGAEKDVVVVVPGTVVQLFAERPLIWDSKIQPR